MFIQDMGSVDLFAENINYLLIPNWKTGESNIDLSYCILYFYNLLNLQREVFIRRY